MTLELPIACRIFEDLMRHADYFVFGRHPFEDTLPDHVNPDCWEYVLGLSLDTPDHEKVHILILEADDIAFGFNAAAFAVNRLAGRPSERWGYVDAGGYISEGGYPRVAARGYQ